MVAFVALEIRDRRLFLAPALSVSFQAMRITQISMGNRPLSMGALPVELALDHPKSPAAWKQPDAVLVGIDPALTFWLGFYNEKRIPHALKVRTGRTNTISGGPWDKAQLQQEPQNYVVAPPQTALYGVCRQGTVEPFTFEHGLDEAEPGMELLGFPPRHPAAESHSRQPDLLHCAEPEYGGAVWGVIPDTGGSSHWDTTTMLRALVFFVSLDEYETLTGKARPRSEDRGEPVPRLP